MEGPNPVLDLALRHGLITPEQAAQHPDVRTPLDLVERGLVRAEDLARVLGVPDPAEIPSHDGTRTRAVAEALQGLRAESAPPPASIGRYRILGELGRGGMGIVYRAEDTVLKREVALKVVRPGFSEEERARFVREARAAATLQHPNIVAVHDVGEAEGRPYFVMDVLAGESLARRIDRRNLPRRAAVDAVRQAADAVAFAHDRGVLHRDIKPANIVVTPEAKAVVMDFGLAKLADPEGPNFTVSGIAFGTPAYMSPEQARGKWKEVDARSDVYSLGATLYEVLTGQPPFFAESVADTIQKVLSAEPIPPTDVDPSIERDLELVALKALEKEPHRRYATAREFADDLGRWLAGEPVRASRPSVWRRLRRRRGALAVLAGGVAAFLALAAWLWPARAEIDSSPQGASIWIDGEDTGLRTPARMTMWPPGRRNVVLHSAHYDPEKIEVDLRFRKRFVIAKTLVPDHGFLSIETNPPGSEATVGGQPAMTTPVVDFRVPKGDVTVEVSRPGRQTYRETVTVKAAAKVSLKIELSPEPLWTREIPAADARGSDDLDGDGVVDAIVVDPSAKRITAVSGRTGEILWKFVPAGRVAQVHARGFGDADRDGIRDLLVVGETFVSACSGKSGAALWSIDDRMLASLRHELGDVDGDGVADFLAGQGGIDLRSGRTGAVVWSSPIHSEVGAVLSLTAVGDLDGDGAPDAAAWFPGWAGLWGFSGKTGAQLWLNYDMPVVRCVHSVGDVNGDGRTDLVAVLSAEARADAPRFQCLSGADGMKRLWKRDLAATADPPWADLDGKGVASLVARHGIWVELLSGRDGDPLWAKSPGGTIEEARFVTDLNGDGIPDIAAVADGTVLFLLSGKDGAAIAKFDPARRMAGLLPAGDLDGDGRDDVIVGSSGGSGRVWAVAGRSGRPLWEARLPGTVVRPIEVLDLRGAEGILVWSPSALHLLPARPK